MHVGSLQINADIGASSIHNPREPSGGPSTAKMPSENPVLSSTAVVWGEWAAWPLEAPGGYFCFPDNKETHAGLSQPSPTPAQGRGEKQGRGPATVRELRGEARAAHCAGASRRPLGQIGRQGAERASVRGSGEGAFRGWDGIWIHLIRSEE